MSIFPTGPKPDKDGVLYADGRTKQSFKDQCDINKILKRAQKSGTLSHLVKHGAHYGDFSDVPDLLTAHSRIQAGQRVFDELPSELRREFGDQFRFFEFVNDPENKDRLEEVLPALAKPGRQFISPRRTPESMREPDVPSSEAPETPAGGSPSPAGD